MQIWIFQSPRAQSGCPPLPSSPSLSSRASPCTPTCLPRLVPGNILQCLPDCTCRCTWTSRGALSSLPEASGFKASWPKSSWISWAGCRRLPEGIWVRDLKDPRWEIGAAKTGWTVGDHSPRQGSPCNTSTVQGLLAILLLSGVSL